MIHRVASPARPPSDGLRAAGHFLDQQARRLLNLALVEDGLVATLAHPDIRRAGDALLLTPDDLDAIAAQARSLRGQGRSLLSADHLFPTGYEDFLRALSAVAARHNWTWLRLVPLGDQVIVRYGGPGERQETVLTLRAIREMLNHAFRQRRSAEPGTASAGAASDPAGQPDLVAAAATPAPASGPAHADTFAVHGPQDHVEMPERLPYDVLLDAVGYYLVGIKAADVLITELAGGVLVTGLVGKTQRADALDGTTLTRLCAEAVRHRGRDSRLRVRARLRAVGRYLDAHKARAIVVQERAAGFSLEFTGIAMGNRTSDLRRHSRLHELLNDERLQIFAA